MKISDEKIEEICKLVATEHVSPEQACDLVNVDYVDLNDLIENNEKIDKRVRKAKAKAVQFWEKRMREAEKSGQAKAAQIQLRALDPRYRKKTDDDESFTVTVETVDVSHLPRMPIHETFGGDNNDAG